MQRFHLKGSHQVSNKSSVLSLCVVGGEAARREEICRLLSPAVMDLDRRCSSGVIFSNNTIL